MADEAVKDPAQATPTATIMTGSQDAPQGTQNPPAADPNAKPADGAKPAEGAKDQEPADKKPEAQGAPETYGDFKMPDGVVVDPARLEGFHGVAKELDLSQEKAQKLIDWAAKNGQMTEQQHAQAWAQVREDWQKEISADPEIGGHNLPATVQYAKRALAEFGSPALTEMLNRTGFGDNPELVRVFAKIGQKMSEDKLFDGKPSGTAEAKSAAEVMFGQ